MQMNDKCHSALGKPSPTNKRPDVSPTEENAFCDRAAKNEQSPDHKWRKCRRGKPVELGVEFEVRKIVHGWPAIVTL